MSLSSEKAKIITADITYYNSSLGREELLKVSSLPFPGYLPIITSVLPFSVSVGNSGISNGWGGLVIANINGDLDYLVCDVNNSYVFNKRAVTIQVYVNNAVVLTKTGIILDMSTDNEASVTLRYTDPIAQLDQPVVTINPDGTNIYSNDKLDRYKPYTLNQLYNDIRQVNTGIPVDNPRYSERHTVLPFCMGDVFNYTPLNLDFIYTDYADQYYLICPPSLNLSVTIHQVKDGGVVLLKEGEQLAGQISNWQTVGGNPWVFKMRTTPFNQLTIDATVGPSRVKEVIAEILNNYPKYGSYQRDATFYTNDLELGISGDAAIGYVGTCSDSISNIITNVCSSVSLTLYSSNDTTLSAYRQKLPPLSTAVIDPMLNFVSYYSADRLRDGRFIDRDDNNNPGFSGTTAGTIIEGLEGTKKYYNFVKKAGWSISDTTTGKATRYFSNTALSQSFSIDFFFKPDLTDGLLVAKDFMPLMELITFKHMNIQTDYIQRLGTLVGNTVTETAETDMQSDTMIGIRNISSVYNLTARTGTNTWANHPIIDNDWNYICLQYDVDANQYSVYLNTTRVAQFASILNLGFRSAVLGGAYSLMGLPNVNDPDQSAGPGGLTDAGLYTLWDGNAALDIFQVHKPLEYSGGIDEIRITNKLRHSGTSITVPASNFAAYTNKTVSKVISYGDIVKGTFKLARMNIPQKASVYLGYAKNWTPGEVSAGIFSEFPSWKEALAKEYYEIYKSNEQLISTYKFTPVSSQSIEATLLVDPNDAELESEYRLELYTKKTLEIVMQVHPDVINSVEIGDIVVIKHHRYGIDPYSGRPGIVIGKSTDLVNNSHSIAVII